MPGQDEAAFSLTSAFIPGGQTNRNVLTGFLAVDESALARCLGRLDESEPEACRAAAAPWSPRAMAASYVELYDRVLHGVGVAA